MRFAWDGQRVRFSHTSNRQKYRNLLKDGRVSFHVQEPENAYRTLEVRGSVVSMDPDPGSVFCRFLQKDTTQQCRSSMRKSASSLW
jgi:hypothetical protein